MAPTITGLDEATAMFDAHCLAIFGCELPDFLVIPDSAPFTAVREGIRDYLGPEVKATSSDIREILETLEGADLYSTNGYRFFDPNQFLVAVAVTIEI